jgi:hypothetical protein
MVDQTVAGLDASQVMIYVRGVDPRKASWRDRCDAIVDIGSQSVIQATVYAPYGTVSLGDQTDAVGAFLGYHVLIGEQVELTLDSGFK